MNRPRRVAVTAPPETGVRSRPVPARPVPETVLERDRAAHARRVRHAQLRRAAITLACGALLLLGLPVLLHGVPGLAAWRLGRAGPAAGVPCPGGLRGRLRLGT